MRLLHQSGQNRVPGFSLLVFSQVMATESTHASILVIDDDSMSRELLEVLLEAEGYAVRSAASGEAALDLLAHDPPPRLILTDVQLPGISGPALAARLRDACGPATTLLAVSGSQPPQSQIAAFDGFLLKPFSVAQIAAALAGPPPAEPRTVEEISTSSAAEIPASAPQTASNSTMQMYVEESGVSAPDSSATPILNEKIYQQLAGTMPTQQLHEMYALCVNDARERIALMRTLIERHDIARFVREAHAIKGSCGMLGATQLHGMAAELEQGSTESSSPGRKLDVNSLDELSAACDRLERMLGSRV